MTAIPLPDVPLEDSLILVHDQIIPIPFPGLPVVDIDSSLHALAWGQNIPTLSQNDARLHQPVVNLSGSLLTTNQLELLSLGLNYRVTPGKIPRLKIMSGIESAYVDLKRADPEGAEVFRTEAARILYRAKNPISNLSAGLKEAAKQLRRNENIVITSADKGGELW